MTRLETPPNSAWIKQFSRVAIDDKGRYYIAPTNNNGSILVFDSRGNLIETVGRLGQGPGEYSYSPNLRIFGGRADSVLVFDPDNQRLTVLSPALEYVRHKSFPSGFDYLTLSRDLVVLTRNQPTPDLVGLPLHVVKPDGTTSSFGNATNEKFSRTSPWDLERQLARAGREVFWAHHLNSYEMELWTTSGKLIRSLHRKVPWFPARLPDATPNDPRPKPWFTGMWQTANGDVWTLISVEDPKWMSNAPKQSTDGKYPYPSIEQNNGLRDTIIELLDGRSARLKASGRQDVYITGVIGDDLVFSVGEARGQAYIDVWRVKTIPALRR